MFWVIAGVAAAAVLWVGGFILACCAACSDYESPSDRIFGFLMICLIFGALGLACFLPSTSNIVRDEKEYQYHPTFLLKTNDVTFIVYVDHNNDLWHWESKDAFYWNADNLVVTQTKGLNLWGYPVSKTPSTGGLRGP